jgi:DnaJ-class molecular chaperone
MIRTPRDRNYYAPRFAQVLADYRREEEREAAAHAVQVECGNCDGTGQGRLFTACISCGGSGRVEEEE